MTTVDAGQRTGLAILAALVIAAAAWITVQGKAAPAELPAVPPLIEAPGPARFRADAAYLPNDALLGFVQIPAGSFLMGSDPNEDHAAFENERWSAASFQGSVSLPAYYIARYETTVAQYRAFVVATGYKADPRALQGASDHPVTHVAWTDALAYSHWLTSTLARSGKTTQQLRQLLREGWKFTLPDEAQWEKAARGGNNRIFPSGRSATGRANFGGSGTSPVGSFTCDECAFGLADMSGNVWELTRSPFQPYPFEPATQRGDLQGEALFVMRGGSYMDPEQIVRAATRGGVDPGARREFIGFRLVLAAVPR